MTFRVFRFIAAATAAALVLGASGASANVLVADGFSRTIADGQTTAPYPTAATQQGTLSSYPSVYDGTIVGFNTGKKWLMYGSQPRVHGYDLRLPAAMTAAGFSSMGENCVGMNRGSANSKNRYARHDLASDILKRSSGTIYVRALMHLDSNAAIPMVSTSDSVIVVADNNVNYYGIGFSPRLDASLDAASCTSLTDANGAFGFFFLKNKTGAVSLIFRVKSAPGTVIERKLCDVSFVTSGATIAGGQNTYIAYAEIKIGAGANGEEIVRAGAKRVLDYNSVSDLTWATLDPDNNSEALTCDFMTASVYPKALYFDGCYLSQGYALFDEIVVGTSILDVLAAPETPSLANETLSGGPASYVVSATVMDYAADEAGALASDGTNAAIPFSVSAVAVNSPFSALINTSSLLTDTTYNIAAYAEKATGGTTNWIGTIYTGELTLGATSDANEYNLVPGGVTVSRANAEPFPLTVNYTISGSAGSEGTTWAAPTAVTIPANAASAFLPVVPIVDPSITEDITTTVTLAGGNYEIPAVASATLTLFNIVPPAGTNTWIAVADGLASVGSNWSSGLPPTSSDDVLFDGRFSSANCTWDAPAAVASWTQTAEYDGTVEFQTTYADGAFPIFSITGDCTVNGGKWTHHSNTNVASGAAAEYRLNVSVGGDFTLGSGAQIDLIGRGYNVGRYPAGSQVGVHAATGRGTYSAVYGDIYAPEDIGSGGENANHNTSAGGGAVKLVITGAAIIDGTIAANACSQKLNGNNPEKGYGAGGSVFVTADSISGSGTVDVSARPAGSTDTSYTGYPGSGGRMALVATSGSVTIPMANLLANGSLGGYSAGAGTIFLKNAADTNGSLLVGNNAIGWNFTVRYPRKDGCTCVKPGETWTFDHVYVRDSGILSVPANATLSLPGGFESVSSLTDSSTPLCGILYLGGTITLPSREEHVLSGPWMFMAAEPFTFNGDVRLTSKASIGSFQLYADSVAAYPACTVSVAGDLTVEAGASLYAKNRGRRGSDSSPDTGYHGGSVASGTRHLQVYDSILSPTLGGTGGRSKGDMGNTNPGGGAIVLTVTGCLTLNGNADVGTTPVSGDHNRGAAGTLNITAGTIAGTGSITANGANGTSGGSRGAGGGGRVAVRLTDAGATFADFSGSITAEGNNANSKSLDYGSSAGTVYLQDGNTAAGAGTIRVANISPSTAVDARTGFPSLSNGEPIDDLSKASLEIANNSRIVLIADVKVESVNIESGSSIDLNGHSITVRAARAGGVKIPPGIYADGATLPIGVGTLDDYLLDTAAGGGGSLIVRSRATFILLQ